MAAAAFGFILLLEKTLSNCQHPAVDNHDGEDIMLQNEDYELNPVSVLPPPALKDHHNHVILAEGGNWVLPLVMSFCLSLHSFLFGLSIGVSSTWLGAFQMVVVVCLHKFIESFALGLCFMGKHLHAIYMLIAGAIYVLMVPAGGILGMFLMHSVSSRTASTMKGVVQGLTAGCFIYMAATCLSHEFSDGKRVYERCFAFIVGIILVSILVIWM